MKRKNNKKLKLFSLVFMVLFMFVSQTMVYSAINSTMAIKGNAYARAEADVRITNFKLSSFSSNSTSYYEEFSVNTISTKFNLIDSSSSIVFDVEITNYGSADVGILQLVGIVPSGLSYEIINYNLKDKICDDTGKCNQMAVKTFQIKFTGTPGEYEVNLELDFRTYHKVTYTDITNNGYPIEVIDGENLNITFTENLKKVLILSNGVEVNHYDQISSGQTITIENVSKDIEIKQEKLIRVVSGDLDTVGSEICIGDECFYVISSDESSVTMLSMMNISTTDEPIQSTDAQTVAFSSTNYWLSTVSSYPAYVYDSNSTLYNYLENYKKYLENVGSYIYNVRVISHDELEQLGCVGYNCFDAPKWVYSTTYWTGTITRMDGPDEDYIFRYVLKNSNGDTVIPWTYSYFASNIAGIRAVIEMPKWEFSDEVDFNIDGVTYQYKEGMTWEEWIDSKYNVDGFITVDRYTSVTLRKISEGDYMQLEKDEPIDPTYIYTFNGRVPEPAFDPIFIIKN